jgi:sodium transport system ATP-binding protein
MILVNRLTKTYEDPDGGEVTAARDVCLTCRAGEIYGLLGPNGAGKTTTLRCLATILTPTSGTATIAGHDLVTAPQAVRRSIGFLSANTGLYARLTPRETLRFFGELHGMQGDTLSRRVEEVLALFDITGYADRPNDRLSTGMKQRVGLARAVVHDPPVLILDEPTSGLDPIVSHTVEQAVISLKAAGKCVLFSTHLLAQAEDICDRIGIIGQGRVLAEGTIADLCALTGTTSLRRAFFALADRAEISAPSAAAPSSTLRGFAVEPVAERETAKPVLVVPGETTASGSEPSPSESSAPAVKDGADAV